MKASHPQFNLAVWSPAIFGILLVLWYGGLPGLRRYLSRLLPWRVPNASLIVRWSAHCGQPNRKLINTKD